MSSAIQEQFRSFASELIELRGGLVDWHAESDHGQAMLPAELWDRSGDEQMVPLSTQPGGAGLCVSLASDFLETAEHWLETVPRIGAVQLAEVYLKRGDLSEAVARAFTWLNAKVRVAESQPDRIHYDTWWLHALLASEDRWESRFCRTVNVAADVAVSFPNPLELWERQPLEADPPDLQSSYQAAVAAAKLHIPHLAADFLALMDRRLVRDRDRLKEYYNALRKEATQRQKRSRSPNDPDQLEAADRAVRLELQRKLAELEERYAIDATIEPLVVIRTQLPVLRVELQVHRKQWRRSHAIYWNSLAKAFDPIRCSDCGCGAFAVAFTNEHVAPLCSNCYATQ